jgi:hypothetical protein
MAPILNFLISSGSKKKEPRCACLSETKVSHSHKMSTEVSYSVPYFLQVGLLLSPITCKCLLKVLCLVRGPITILDCILLKDNNWALVASLGPEINSWACLCSTRMVACGMWFDLFDFFLFEVITHYSIVFCCVSSCFHILVWTE